MLCGRLLISKARLLASKTIAIMTLVPAEQNTDRAIDSVKCTGCRAMWSGMGNVCQRRSYYKELHLCRICNDMAPCQDCTSRLWDGLIRTVFCSKDHECVKLYLLTQPPGDITSALLEQRFEV
ncbi:hypothetical protein BAUCODRAFT_311974 [Baudoinia panamericana UAMH 10762]|uniref:Uncharacterized protein n=1 Tax=Baudoinia panamericana (strain UAMH 10762) TaxID=717646 RepID=M2MKU2_BAUPA|nr:uncharacterized protein BAUCODRAFT_311974 [Baudoinia panamericana UAMH 10762]EMC91953.1 hypothetical protein BAUCODRAFT_311974 [Baudoinia panamericana UAMH 10762]